MIFYLCCREMHAPAKYGKYLLRAKLPDKPLLLLKLYDGQGGDDTWRQQNFSCLCASGKCVNLISRKNRLWVSQGGQYHHSG